MSHPDSDSTSSFRRKAAPLDESLGGGHEIDAGEFLPSLERFRPRAGAAHQRFSSPWECAVR